MCSIWSTPYTKLIITFHSSQKGSHEKLTQAPRINSPWWWFSDCSPVWIHQLCRFILCSNKPCIWLKGILKNIMWETNPNQTITKPLMQEAGLKLWLDNTLSLMPHSLKFLLLNYYFIIISMHEFCFNFSEKIQYISLL